METVLQHHGILGMKWGVRRYQNKDGTLTPEGKARYGEPGNSESSQNLSSTKQTSVRTSRTQDMSDDELKEVVNRLQMEKRYRDLMKELTAKEKSAGKKFVESVLNDAGKQVATEYTKKLMSKGLDKLLKEAEKETKK